MDAKDCQKHLGQPSGCCNAMLYFGILLFIAAGLSGFGGIVAILWTIAITAAAYGLTYREERSLEADRWKRLFELLNKSK